MKTLMDFYELIKTRFFSGRKIEGKENSWWKNEDAPFFVTKNGDFYSDIRMKYVTDALKFKILAYDIRRIVTSWGLNCTIEEIRLAESQSLHHGPDVAKKNYLTNKQTVPQRFAQTFVEEEGIYPDHMLQSIKAAEKQSHSDIQAMEEESVLQRKQRLMNDHAENKINLMNRRSLGPTQRIEPGLRSEFKEILESESGLNVDELITDISALKWRHFVVRLVFSIDGEPGQKLRDIWQLAYKGDLLNGIRDMRFTAESKGWPIQDKANFVYSKDRNTWIAGCFLRAFRNDKKLRSQVKKT